jgi:hypothetical protein
MSLPPQYESRSAELRIRSGLEKSGVSVGRSEWAARMALDEAPFIAPSDDGWAVVCVRARWLARSSLATGYQAYDLT